MSENCGPTDAHADHDDSHGGMGCAEVIAEVWTLLDGECTPETRERLRRH
ncbi:mycothiol system anti-sigma-R factor, partial [Siccibacter turicensis]